MRDRSKEHECQFPAAINENSQEICFPCLGCGMSPINAMKSLQEMVDAKEAALLKIIEISKDEKVLKIAKDGRDWLPDWIK